jgi:4-amino-4-deoxy-L-arabinose transferase-like glycosyltransferase
VVALVSILLGAVLTIASAYAIGAMLVRQPPEIALAAGAAVLSVLIFLIVWAGMARWPGFLVLAVTACGAGLRFARPHGEAGDPPHSVLASRERLAAVIIFGAYGLWYFVNALAPETLPDGVDYHLGLPFEYVRRGGFGSHITFFDTVPQGMEMLYTMAFAFGRHSAAKLVEFALFLATPSLILRIARRLGMSDLAGLVAAVLYFCAPVAGLTGSSSYNDAALVFFTLAAFYSLLAWRDTDGMSYLAAAGLAAGFCYAIKLPGLYAGAAAGLFVIARRRGALRPALVLAASAALIIAPWVLRNWVLTGDPVAPFANSLFPNSHFHAVTENELSSSLASLGRVKPLDIPWELAFGDGFTGTFGPLLWALPLGLAAWRSRAGRLCLMAALILALAWVSNKGARFLMPAVAMAGFPLAMVLTKGTRSGGLPPRHAAWAAIVLQAVVCWPPVLNGWQPEWTFRLHGFPWRAALRIQPEEDYLARNCVEYRIAQMIESSTPPGARTFSFGTVADAYLTRDVTVSWQSAEGDRMADALRLATLYRQDTTYAWSAAWPLTALRALRFRLPVSHPAEWDIAEVELESGGERIYDSPQWTLRSWPNPWEAPAALDSNLATRWRTWQPMRAGMFFEIDFDRPQKISKAVLISHTPLFGVPLEFYGQAQNGRWRRLSQTVTATPLPDMDLRLQATAALRQAGFGYLLAPTTNEGNGPIGSRVAADPLSWDMERIARNGDVALFRIR